MRFDPSVPFMDVGAGNETVRPALDEAISRTLGSGLFLLGPELEAFESEFADYCGVRHCVGVGSGLAAIELSLMAAGVGPGDEVIVPAYTWVATWLAVTRTGAQPVGVDVEEGTFNLDPELIEAAVTERTAAIVPVHLRGETADMAPILGAAEKHGLLVVEDAAQSHGARYRGRRAGALGGAGAFSFYPSKNLGALGDGGAVTTDDEGIADRARLLRNYGMKNRYEIEMAGVNSRLAELQAAALRVKLPRLDEWNAARVERAAIYRRALELGEAVGLPAPIDEVEPVWHLFVVTVADRDDVLARLNEEGVGALVHYPVLPHLSPAYRGQGWGEGDFPVAERLARSALSLPMYPQLDPRACASIAELLLEITAA